MVFPKEFFAEEDREGFVVSEMMKRAWAAALEVLEVIKSVCSQNGLTYYAYGGTLLGCIRHKGFIPWDDDIDICMLRSDYDRFFEIADSVLPEGFRVSGIYASESRLREANREPQGRIIADETVFTLPKYMDYFHAFPYMRIGIDIFPMDYLPEDPSDQYDLVNMCNEMQKTARFLDTYRANGSLKSRLKTFKPYMADTAYDSDEELIQSLWYASDRLAASTLPTDKVFDVLYLSAGFPSEGFAGYKAFNPKDMGKGISMPFECTTINVPENYKDVLTAEFGIDYMTPRMFTGDHEYPFYRVQEEAFAQLLKESGVDIPVDEFCRNWHRMNGGT